MESKIIYKRESYLIKQACIEVKNHLGTGLLEKVYRNALPVEMRNLGLKVETEKEFDVYYKGVLVGQYFADNVVEDKIILEIKACNALNEAHISQLINYLKISGYKLGILINFQKDGTGFDFKRIVN